MVTGEILRRDVAAAQDEHHLILRGEPRTVFFRGGEAAGRGWFGQMFGSLQEQEQRSRRGRVVHGRSAWHAG
jgi:hypothetical protein